MKKKSPNTTIKWYKELSPKERNTVHNQLSSREGDSHDQTFPLSPVSASVAVIALLKYIPTVSFSNTSTL